MKRYLNTPKSINFFHFAWSGFRSSLSVWFQIGEFFNLIIVNWKTELNHSVNSSSERWWFIKTESRGQKGSVEQKPNKILNGLITSILLRFSSEFGDNWMFRVEFHSLLRDHIIWSWRISKCLSFHDSFHVGWPSIFTCDKCTGWFSQSLSNLDFLNFIS